MKNIVYESAEILKKQMEIVQKCNDTDLETEMKRLDSLSKSGSAIATMAESQAKMYIQTGTLPEHNLLFSDNEKVFTNKVIENKPLKTKGLLVDEFTRGAVKQ